MISIFAKRTLNGIKKENTDSNPSCKNRESWESGICDGCTGGLLWTLFSSASEFTYRGKDFPCMTAHLKYGPAIRNLILHQQFELSYIYEEPLKHFDEDTAIHVENIQGNILFIYAKEDLMWPSKEAVAYMVNRLEKHRFAFRVDVLEYEKASHILVPLNPSKLKMFKIERQYPEDCRRSREDAFHKTIKWISEVK
ncbi:acyl-CoA thioester hydrolase/BAAT C-terminal domain-containing protein [Lachnoclostridium sp. An76]|uniref:acyl-CoA thioester hydrolase/BAAT C-terminal domain-containing protein n=1 Tax=Lachnoclostridium sp. An76 TaxID=1965654 RepID=UPI00117B63C4|nr:acyl-CoA thioester hydrolase/BAAT C-terminal domain-containing protein [Lachnoclostridium sp. An76]